MYFTQPGHVPEQKPDPRTAYAGGPEAWPMCGPCAAVAEVHATLDDGTEQARCGVAGAVAFAALAAEVTCRACRARLVADYETEA